MNDSPARPVEALDGEELDRFLHSCSHERRSPTTQRTIDAMSYGWIHKFIREWTEPTSSAGATWLDLGGAHPDQLEGYFSRVATRLRDHPSGEYASQLAGYFKNVERTIQGWPDSY